MRLRQSLRTFVGENALAEVSIHSPTGEGEASFLRLVAWSYVLIFEAGRITIPYLLKLPSGAGRSQAELEVVCALVHDLRTWSSHNLGLIDERELGISRRTSMWFINNAGANPPNDFDGWRRCYECLCTDVRLVLLHCRGAVELVLSERQDDSEVIVDLKRRLDRNWPARKFDELVIDAATRMGQNLDVTRFRLGRLQGWREFLETIPDGDDPEAQVVCLIERDVLEHFASVLPLDGKDVMVALHLDPGHEVGEALRNARRLWGLGITEKDELLARLVKEHSAD